jgi:hypothetical protein
MSDDNVPLNIVKGLTGVQHAFYLDPEILQILRDEESKVVKGTMDIGVNNIGFL